MNSDLYEVRDRALVTLLRYQALLEAARAVVANTNDVKALRQLVAAVRQFDENGETGKHDS